MSGAIQQLNVQFDPLEDRLVLRILSNTNDELRLWLTRRFTRLLLGVLDQLIDSNDQSPYADQMKEFKRDAALSGSNFDDQYRGDQQTAYPLGEKPLLVSRIDYKKLEDGNTLLTLGQEGEGGQSISINLNHTMLHALIKLLLTGGQSAEWELGKPSLPTAAKEGKPQTKSTKILH